MLIVAQQFLACEMYELPRAQSRFLQRTFFIPTKLAIKDEVVWPDEKLRHCAAQFEVPKGT